MHLPGNAAVLRGLARILAELGGHLDLYTTQTDAELAHHGLLPPIVRRIGFFPAAEMAERVAATADALFLSASFEENDRADISTLFPSKLADYTAIGLPIVTWGPAYSSAACWCAENPGAALLFTSTEPGPVREAVVRLASDRAYAAQVAAKGIEAGKRYFDLSIAKEQLMAALTAGRQPRASG